MLSNNEVSSESRAKADEKGNEAMMHAMPYNPMMPYPMMPWWQPYQNMYNPGNIEEEKSTKKSTTSYTPFQPPMSTTKTDITNIDMPSPPPIEDDINYTQGFLKTQIGQRIKIEFLIGTNMLIDREGTLVNVGISYVLIKEVDTGDLVMCDIYSIKFVRIFD